MKDVSFSDCLIYRILKLQRLNEPSRAHCINVVLIALVGLSSGDIVSQRQKVFLKRQIGRPVDY